MQPGPLEGGEEPVKSKILTREEMQSGMRVMTPSGGFHGAIVDINDRGISVQWDNTTGGPITWKWEDGLLLAGEE